MGLDRVLVGIGAGMPFHRHKRVEFEGIWGRWGDSGGVVEWWRAHGRRRTMLVSSSMVNRVAILCALAVASATSGSAMTDRSQKSDNRCNRDAALRALNEVAAALGLDAVALRAKSPEIVAFYKNLCASLPHEHVPAVRAATVKWSDSGGAQLPDKALTKLEQQLDDNLPDGDGEIASHRVLQQQYYGARRGAFRLQSKAFMLTFNALAFVASPELWAEYQSWVEEQARRHEAAYWSCTLELSTRAQENGRVHLHGYWSWHGQSAGVDQRNTDGWMFHGVRPRVDVNSDHRGPREWLRAAQHGHFYVQVHKLGTVYAATNYPAWGGAWAPEHWWITTLWKQHKLDHDQFLRLSAQFREGHDRRRAWVDAVRAAESSIAHEAEKDAALALIESRAKGFKPLPAHVEMWKMQYEDKLVTS